MSFRRPSLAARVALTLLALFTGNASPAQRLGEAPFYTMRSWRQPDGLLSNEISALCQDQNGYLWIATTVGLTRFDGTRFLNYDYSAHGKLPSDGIASIIADPASDDLWAAPYAGGLMRVRAGNFEPQTLPENYTDKRIARLHIAADHALWIAFEGGDVMRLKEGITKYSARWMAWVRDVPRNLPATAKAVCGWPTARSWRAMKAAKSIHYPSKARNNCASPPAARKARGCFRTACSAKLSMEKSACSCL
ncbi:ligand-binding sensor domain-containing protein [Oleiharenicola lentus]|uniref:ligand-binding sensor domain-containing protein n=1 Tax=Oleiharenicola lentus TaxID=2508720 RepID=UPI003F663A93